MRVLHVIPSVSAVHGGPSRALAEIERALAARGIEVTTITTNDDGDARTLPVECGCPMRTAAATRWYFPRSSVLYKISIRMAQWLRRNIKGFDVVHAHALFSFAPVAAATMARHARIPYIVRPLGVLNRYGMSRHHPLMKRASFALVERPLIEAASAVHFTSQAERIEAESLNLSCRGVVIPLGIDIGSVATAVGGGGILPPDGPRLLFLSRIDPKKNLEGLLHALSRLLSRHPDLALDIAGDGDPNYVLGLKSLATELHVSDRIRWHGHLDGQRKADILASATAFVLPSFSENFGIAVVEALAVGLPCIVSREVAVHKDIEEANAGVIIGTDPESIAAGIESLLTNQARYPALRSAAARLAFELFSLAKMGERLEALYRSISLVRASRSLHSPQLQRQHRS
jgi:glycosyltransferase involved in cell wall biosynthesis